MWRGVKLSTTKAAIPHAANWRAHLNSRASETPPLPWTTTMAGVRPLDPAGSSKVPKTVVCVIGAPRTNWK